MNMEADEVRRIFQRATELIEEEQYGETLRLLSMLVDAHLDYFKIWGMKAYAHCELGQYVEALQAADRALAVHPKSAHAWALRGEALRGLIRVEEAKDAAQRAIALDPSLSAPHALIASLSEYQHDYPTALRFIELALERMSDSATNWRFKGDLLVTMGDMEGAVAAYTQALTLEPARADLWLRKGSALQRLARWPEAAGAYREALARDPANLAALKGLVDTLVRMGRWQEVLDVLPIQRDPALSNPRLQYEEARALTKLRRYDDALAVLEELLAH